MKKSPMTIRTLEIKPAENAFYQAYIAYTNVFENANVRRTA